jgi:hypothetical protein
MEPLDTLDTLARRARVAYERARLRHALLDAWPVPLAAVLASRLGSSASWVATLALLLFVAAVALRWRGRELGRGVPFGLLAGIAPLLAPAITLQCVQGCSLGGAVGVTGMVVGLAAAAIPILTLVPRPGSPA